MALYAKVFYGLWRIETTFCAQAFSLFWHVQRWLSGHIANCSLKWNRNATRHQLTQLNASHCRGGESLTDKTASERIARLDQTIDQLEEAIIKLNAETRLQALALTALATRHERPRVARVIVRSEFESLL
ncbi:hypothetical protein J8I87_40880 [Paraburkholderia sp. LEh10]|uniref:hypothetical protein n=1 Tax=Paraburkholderia sp. LEh10 TaxID=2821353 RepID=UPI001AE4A6D1|nr:hypothetical protein [Paraburkholderia sp. LEh10]MBP0595868.1 hypothetical protein [Paraburkholderia sp. LEh10]